MHEASLMTNLMRKIDETARAQAAKRVIEVSVWLGALSHMTPSHFAEHFEHAAAGTIADGARLDVTTSDDIGDANAQDVLLKGLQVEV
jgi:hydrogenase nickel incorporation protein HypA/HybF